MPLLLSGDLRSEQHCKDLVAHTEQAFGGLDLLVLNAAHQRNRGGIDEIPTDDFEHVVRVNLFAPVFLARAAVPLMDAGLEHHHDDLDPGLRPVERARRLRDDEGGARRVHEGARRGARARAASA